MTPLERAKEVITIPRLAELLGWDWKPGRSCRVPYREDRSASGSLLEGDRLLHDFSTGETHDAARLLALVRGISNADACRLLIELAGSQGDMKPVSYERPREAAAKRGERRKPLLPFLQRPAREDVRQIAELRGLSVDGVGLAASRGFLFVTRWAGFRCWALTDETRWVCQLRRMNGEPFPQLDGGTYKARTCKGSWAAWPIGCTKIQQALSVALVEGGGDFLAAWHFIAAEGAAVTCAPVGILGAGQRIPAEALHYFHGKRVRIFAHVDPPGRNGKRPGLEAAARWEAQLEQAGAIVTTFDLSDLRRSDGAPVEDLNDMAAICSEDYDATPELSALMTF